MEQEKKTTTHLSKDECVKIMTILMKDIIDVYHQFAPDGTYVSLTYNDDRILILDSSEVNDLYELIRLNKPEVESNDK